MIASHFGNPYSEIKSIKDHIIGKSVLPDDLVRSDYLSSRMRHIQKYLILFIKHAEPPMRSEGNSSSKVKSLSLIGGVWRGLAC